MKIKREHIKWGYSIWWLFLFAPLIVSPFFPANDGDFIGWFFIVLFFGFLTGIGFIIFILWCLWLREWAHAISALLSPFLAIALLVMSMRSTIPHWVYLQIHKAEYLEQIAKEPREKGQSLTKSFFVGGWGMVASAQGLYEIVYSENDDYSEANKCKTVEKLEKNFYFVSWVQSGCIFE